jgi:predicted membrane protein
MSIRREERRIVNKDKQEGRKKEENEARRSEYAFIVWHNLFIFKMRFGTAHEAIYLFPIFIITIIINHQLITASETLTRTPKEEHRSGVSEREILRRRNGWMGNVT